MAAHDSYATFRPATQVSETWLQKYVNDKYAHVSQQLKVSAKPKGKLTLECDVCVACALRVAWSFVDSKGNQRWIRLAMDRKTREIVGVFVGDRSKQGARGLWNSLPSVYLQYAICYTDFWVSYENVIPKKCHRSVGKESGKTSHIERFNNTMRQRISRLVRSTLSFSKTLENHIGAIWYFIHHYNACLQA